MVQDVRELARPATGEVSNDGGSAHDPPGKEEIKGEYRG